MVGKPQEFAEEFSGFSTREAILEATDRLCGEVGPSKLKLREIALRVGIKPASIYNHFDGLEGVLASVIRRSLEQEILVLEELQEQPSDLKVRLLCQKMTEFYADRVGIVRLSLVDFADVHIKEPNAFDQNEDLIIRRIDLEAEILAQSLNLTNLSRKRLGEIVTSRRFMTLALLSLTWLNAQETDQARIREIAELAAAFVLGLPSQLTP